LATDPRVRVDLLLLSDQLTRLTGDHVARAVALDELDELADLLRDAELQREASLRRVQLCVAREDRAAYRAAVDRMRALATDAAPRWRARLLLEEARNFSSQGDLEGLQLAAAAVLTIADETGDHAMASGGLLRLSEVHMHRGQLSESTALMQRAHEAAARTNDFAAETECCRASFLLAYHAGELERCVALGERLLAIGVQIGDRYSEAAAHLRIGIAWLASRREIARTREKFATAIAIYEELENQAGIAGVLHNRSMLENEIGNFGGAIADTERALEMFKALGDNRAVATALGNLGQLRAVAGDVARACEDAEAARRLAHASAYHIQEACAIENLAAAVAAGGDILEALRLGNEALAHHRNAESANWSGRLLADLAVWYMLAGDLESARARVDEMLAQRVPMATESSQRFFWAIARVLHACGEEAMAKRELTRARELVSELAAELSREDRERFEAVAWNREIIAAFDRDEWP
jgi:tetratricopeptide (TPR) repeat protein